MGYIYSYMYIYIYIYIYPQTRVSSFPGLISVTPLLYIYIYIHISLPRNEIVRLLHLGAEIARARKRF